MKQSTKLGIVAALVAALAVPMVPAAASAAPSPTGLSHGVGASRGVGHGKQPHAAPMKDGPTSIAYVEVNNDQLANVGRYTLADGANAFDVAIIFAANINWDGSKAVLYNNENVQRTLDDAATQIRPLQAKGIKVSLSILGNHQGAGIANFPTQAAAEDFAAQVSATVAKYGLDGVDLDDEYSDYGTNGTPQPNQQSIGWLISALRADMPGKLVSFYDIGPASDALSRRARRSVRSSTTPGTPTTARTRRRRSPGSGSRGCRRRRSTSRTHRSRRRCPWPSGRRPTATASS